MVNIMYLLRVIRFMTGLHKESNLRTRNVLLTKPLRLQLAYDIALSCRALDSLQTKLGLDPDLACITGAGGLSGISIICS